jgi:TetR/AcrR family transcriptional regulator, lmrAB and yxaGH operons repressor
MSKEEAITKLIPVFRQYGYEGATLSRLSQATGLGKSSLYHYFPKGKEEMAEAVLEYVNNWFAATIITPLWSGKNPKERLEQMCQKLGEFYQKGQETCLLNVISLGEGNDLFHATIQKALQDWINELTEVLIQAGIDPEIAEFKAQEAVMLIQGSLVLVRGLGDTAPFERVIDSLPQKLLASV